MVVGVEVKEVEWIRRGWWWKRVRRGGKGTTVTVSPERPCAEVIPQIKSGDT